MINDVGGENSVCDLLSGFGGSGINDGDLLLADSATRKSHINSLLSLLDTDARNDQGGIESRGAVGNQVLSPFLQGINLDFRNVQRVHLGLLWLKESGLKRP